MFRATSSRRSRLTIYFWLLLSVYALVQWIWIRPPGIRNWRESDTQTIAVHLAEPGSSIWYPRIAWGGTGPGYVETEFQLYTFIVAQLLRFTGDVAWPGQLVSLLATLATAWVAFRGLAFRYGELPGLLGALALLSSHAVTLVATSVQPEALCLLLYTAAWISFLHYGEGGDRRWLVSYAFFGGLAMLVKPTAAQLGISSFLLLLLGARQRLKSAELWLAWASMVAGLGLYLLHARNVYLEFGNTFGVLSGGDSKMPHLKHLIMPSLYRAAATNAVKWGAGPVGAAAVVAALLLRRGRPPIVALLVGNVIWTMLALRYTSTAAGTHYHVLGAVLAAQAVACSAAWVETQRHGQWLASALGVALALWLLSGLQGRRSTRTNEYDVPAVEAADALAAVARTGDLVVVRSVESSYDDFWETVDNFQDPRVFYRSKTHGWAIGLDDLTPQTLAERAKDGARFYVETAPRAPSAALDAWLASHARVLATTAHGGRVFAL